MLGAIIGSKTIHLLSRVCHRRSSNSMIPLIRSRIHSSKGPMLAGIHSVRSNQVSKPLIHPQCTGALPTQKRSLNTIHPISNRSSFRINGRIHVWLLAATISQPMSVLPISTSHQSSVVSKRTNLTSIWDFSSPCQRRFRAMILVTLLRVII